MMRSSLLHYGGVAAYSLRASLKRQMEYPAALLGWVVMIPIQYYSGIWMIRVLIERFHTLAGWTFPQIAFLYGLALLSHGIMVAFFIPTWFIEQYVATAWFDRLKLRPMGVFFQFLCQRFNSLGLVDLVPAVTIFLYGARAVGFAFTPGHLAWLLAVVAGGVLVRVGLYTMIGSVAFWKERSYSLVNVAESALHQGTFYPLTIYPLFLQWVLTFLFPAGFVAFYPAAALLGREPGIVPSFLSPFLTAAVGASVFLLGMAVFRAGLRRHEGNGS